MLHIVNKSPFERDSLESCLRMATSGQVLLLIEDGVFAASAANPWLDRIKKTGVRCCAIRADLEARGLQARVDSEVTIVDYAGFVELVATTSCSHSWL